MRVEELEAVCHAASFESSLRRAMAQTSPVCSVSASTDSNISSQSFVHTADQQANEAEAATSSFQHAGYESDYHARDSDQPDNFASAYQQQEDSQGAGLGSSNGFMRQDSDDTSQCSSSETEISGLKQQRHEWEVEREELLKEMGNLRYDHGMLAGPLNAMQLQQTLQTPFTVLISANKLPCTAAKQDLMT